MNQNKEIPLITFIMTPQCTDSDVDYLQHFDELQMKIEPEKYKTPAENAQDRMIGCTTLDIPESYKTEPFTEQQRWIGCVCRFWFDDPNNTVLDYLGGIRKGQNAIQYYGKECGEWFPHCEPVLPTDSVIYKGGDNE